MSADAGSGTVVGAALGAAVLVIAIAVATVAAVHLGATRAQQIADLAAIDGALVARAERANNHGTLSTTGRAAACLAARQTVQANGATLVRCVTNARGDVSVTVETQIPLASPQRASRAGSR